MPNVSGLLPADALLSAHTGTTPVALAYGPHTLVTLDGDAATMTASKDGRTLARVTRSGKPSAKLTLIDGDTVTAVNAFLRPFGKVKTYWRTGEYRWHPLVGAPTAVRKPVVAPVAPVVAPVAAPVIPVATPVAAPVMPLPAPVAPIRVAAGSIRTLRQWRDRYSKQPVTKAVGTKGLFSIVGDVMVKSVLVRRFDAMLRKRQAGRPSFILITGPAGTAKTRLAEQWAYTHDLPVVIVEGQGIQTASDWFGSMNPTSTGFEWVWSDAALLILTGQPCVIILDELNRPENERALNGIMGLTDWKATVFPVGAPHEVTLAPGQCLIATLNEGAEFVGTVEVDAAVRNRFGMGVRMDYSPLAMEVKVLTQQVPGLDKEVAQRLVRIASSQRAKRDDDTQYPSHNVLSTRSLVDIGDSIVTGGMDPVEAIWASIESVFIPEDYTALTNLIEAQFGSTPEDIMSDDDIEQMLAGMGD